MRTSPTSRRDASATPEPFWDGVAPLVQADPTFELHDYSDQRAVLVLETVNADPPETQFEADRIVTLVDTSLNNTDKVLVMLMTRGCLRQIIQVPHKHPAIAHACLEGESVGQGAFEAPLWLVSNGRRHDIL